MARLVAKVWVMFCLYAGALALNLALPGSPDAWAEAARICGATLLYLCTGFLFAGMAVRLLHRRETLIRHSWRDIDFNDVLFGIFLFLTFCDQAFFAPDHLAGVFSQSVEQAAFYAVPGQRALSRLVHSCTMDGGRIFASAFSWCLALIWFGSALSRLKISAGLLRAAWSVAPDRTRGLTSAVLLGLCAAAGIQVLYAGSGIRFLPCSMTAGIAGGLLTGLAPLLLVYVIITALTGLIAGAQPQDDKS